jgi:hypothetical protein
MEVQGPAEALHEGDRSGLPLADAGGPAASALPGEEGAQEGRNQRAKELAIDSQAKTQGPTD